MTYELRQRRGHSSDTIAEGEDLEEIAQMAAEMAGLEADERLRLPGEKDE